MKYMVLGNSSKRLKIMALAQTKVPLKKFCCFYIILT